MRLPIVVALDVGEQIAPRFIPGRPSSLLDELDFKGVEEALHRGIIVAASRAAHRRLRPHTGELSPVGLGRVLAAAIRVADQPAVGRCRWAAIISAATLNSVRM